MVRSRTDEIAKCTAWPLSGLHEGNQTVGLLMPRIPPGFEPIHILYSPKTRVREFPAANWPFLLHVAANIARGFAAIHRAGHVIGDVNHGNILVSKTGTTAFIDCDSFQISANGRVYLCGVGVPTYTPPELQNRSFSSIQRTTNHDAFGLAVLIFHLLFMGRHPFAGRFSGRGEMPIERAIAESRFPFGRLAQQVQMSPPPNSLSLAQIPPPLALAFERAFAAEASRGAQRPAALEWLGHLEQTKTELARCALHKTHNYYSKLASCPWCGLEARGIVLFVEIGIETGNERNIEDLWRRLASLPLLTNLPPLPTVTTPANPAALYQERGKTRRMRTWVGIALVLVVVILSSISPISGGWAFSLFVGSIVLAAALPRKLWRDRAKLAAVLLEHQTRSGQLQANYSVECSDQRFRTRLAEVQQLRTEYSGLPQERQRRIQELERNKYQLQLTQFLDRISLTQAKIAGIGDGRKQMLSAYGVDTAADVTPTNLAQVPGIGPKYSQRLMEWRRSFEPRFRFDPQKALDRLDLEKIDRDIRARRADLENRFANGANEALSAHAVVSTRRKAYAEQALTLSKNVAQLKADYEAS
jgi:DNA-binding helix-hairpin-helix protein with protein kinase domain